MTAVKIMNVYGIPILGDGVVFPDLDKDGLTMLRNFYSKYGENYDLIKAAKNGDNEAEKLLSILWKKKCYLYWNYKNECDNPSFLYDFILFHNMSYEEHNMRIKSYASKGKGVIDESFIEHLFKKIRELVRNSLVIEEERAELVIRQSAVADLCSFINQGVEKKYWCENSANIQIAYEAFVDIVNTDRILGGSKYDMHIYSKKFQALLDINIILPLEGLVSCIYLFEVFYSLEVIENIVYTFIEKDNKEYSRNEAVKKAFSTPSSLKAKFEKYDIGSLRLSEGKKASKTKKASSVIELIEDLYDYTNYRYDNYDDKNEDPEKQTSIIETIRKLPIEWSLFESPIEDNDFKRCVFFRSELLRKLKDNKKFLSRVFKKSRGEIFYNIDIVDSAVRHNLKEILDSTTQYDSVIRSMNNVKERVEEQLPQIEYGDFKCLKNEDVDLGDICVKGIRWIDSQYIVKMLEVSREQSDHVRQMELVKPTDKQKKMFQEALTDYRFLLDFDYSWLNEFLGIDDGERTELDGKVKSFMKKINNDALIGSECKPDNIQKILIYQLCAADTALTFRADRRYYKSGRKKECTLLQILDPKAKQDAKVSIWLNTLMRKQFYVNLGYEEVFNITEDCHNLIADDYKDMLERGLFLSDIYKKYNEELNKIINSFIHKNVISLLHL